jgi:hypothetical protein
MSIYKSHDKKIAIVDWDWKAQPNWAHIMEAVRLVGSSPFFMEAETHSDDYAVVISAEPMSSAEADRIYDQAFGGEWDEEEMEAEE